MSQPYQYLLKFQATELETCFKSDVTGLTFENNESSFMVTLKDRCNSVASLALVLE